jgi:signal transduction histidine kinase
LSKASKELARGNLTYRAKVNTNDEIGDLADDFNTMASQIEQGFSSLKSSMAHQERFMASFAHELKTPMTSIIGFAELLRSQTLTDEEQMDAAHYIFSEGKRLESLSFKLLEIMANDPGVVQMTSVSPNLLIGKLVDHLRPIYEKENIRLHYKGSGGSCLMEPDLIKSLLINLLDNARKAMVGGGAIRIESKVSRGECLISVRDNGKGIPAEALAHLTEAFYRVDKSRARAQGGVGLGLTLCARIVKLHNGHMRFESKEGVGTQITVVLRGNKA